MKVSSFFLFFGVLLANTRTIIFLILWRSWKVSSCSWFQSPSLESNCLLTISVHPGPADIKWVLLFRNDASSIYCPVTCFLLYARLVGLLDMKKGPIYGNLDSHGKLLKAHEHKALPKNAKEMAGAEVRVWYTSEGKMVNYDSRRIGSMATLHFSAVGLCDRGFHCQRVMVRTIIVNLHVLLVILECLFISNSHIKTMNCRWRLLAQWEGKTSMSSSGLVAGTRRSLHRVDALFYTWPAGFQKRRNEDGTKSYWGHVPSSIIFCGCTKAWIDPPNNWIRLT